MPLLDIARGDRSCGMVVLADALDTASDATFAVGTAIPVASLPLALLCTCAAIVLYRVHCPVPVAPAVARRGSGLAAAPGQSAVSVYMPHEVWLARLGTLT